jgi:hypothetical protein
LATATVYCPLHSGPSHSGSFTSHATEPEQSAFPLAQAIKIMQQQLAQPHAAPPYTPWQSARAVQPLASSDSQDGASGQLIGGQGCGGAPSNGPQPT